MPMNTPAIGADIYTADGSKLGTVKEISGTYFKVDAPMQPDFWLSSECVRGGMGSGTTNRVDLSFDKTQLENYKQELD